jgi:aspartyl-tRNA synthetase
VPDGDGAAVDVGLGQVGITGPCHNERAFGWDGITALFDGLDSIREVIACPDHRTAGKESGIGGTPEKLEKA